MKKETKVSGKLIWKISTYASLLITVFYFLIIGVGMVEMLSGNQSVEISAKLAPLDIYSRGAYIFGLIAVVCISATLVTIAMKRKRLDYELINDLMKILLVPVSIGLALSFTVAAGESTDDFEDHLKNLGFYFIGMGISYVPLLMCREGLRPAQGTKLCALKDHV